MKKMLLLALAMTTLVVNAQDQEVVANDDTTPFINAKSTYLTFDMITPLYHVNPRYSFGVIQSLSPHWKIGIDVGAGSDEVTYNWTERRDQEDWSVYEVRFDVYRMLNPTRLVQHYIGAEFFYNYHENALVRDKYRVEDEVAEIFFDSADLERRKFGGNLKYGVFIPFAPQAGMHIYVGAGVRVRNNKHSNIVNPRVNDFIDNDHSLTERYHYYEGTRVRPNVTAGFKLYYKFN